MSDSTSYGTYSTESVSNTTTNTKRLNIIHTEAATVIDNDGNIIHPKPISEQIRDDNDKPKQITLSQADLSNANVEMMFDPEEIEFMNQLNVDSEAKQDPKAVFDTTVDPTDLTDPTRDVTTTTTTTATTTTAITMSPLKPEPVREIPKKIDMEEVQIYVSKCVSRQNISNSLAAMEQDFYDKVSLCSGSMTESSFFYLEEFIYRRLALIINYSKSFSNNISEKLTNEERELYISLSEAVNKFKQTIDGKVGLNR